MTEPEFRVAPQEYDPAVPLGALHEHPENYNEGDMDAILESLDVHGFYGAVIAQKSTGLILAGNHRLRAAAERGAATIPGFWLDCDDEEARRILAGDNLITRLSVFNIERLLALLAPLKDTPRGLAGTGMTQERLLALLRGSGPVPEPAGGPPAPSLADRFLVPPFDVLDARAGWWRDRKAAWLALGIASELGRLPGERDRALNQARADPEFYLRKRQVERSLGRTLATAEFTEAWYEMPEQGVGTGISVFDPVLCELAYRWFCPPGGQVIDPFAGGSVRGIVAAALGRSYHGRDLSAAQVAANEEQAADMAARGLFGGPPGITDPAAITPVREHGGYLVKRDDLFALGGSAGGKVRTCLALAGQAGRYGVPGLVTAGSRHSPQVNIVATVAASLGVPCRVHVPAAKGPLTPELEAARLAGAEITEHRPGHNSVIIARAREDAATRGWTLIPFGMQHEEAVRQTGRQVQAIADLPEPPRRIVVPVGSGMTLAGVLAGLQSHLLDIPVLGVVTGADPAGRLNAYAPGWAARCTLVPAQAGYAEEVDATLGTLRLDPVYEAKCVPFLEDGDLLWVVGCRETARPAPAMPRWEAGDSAQWDLEPESADFLFTCPPYYDLEEYGGGPADLSGMDTAGFDAAYARILGRAVAALRPGRFAVIVTGDARDSRGRLRDLRGVTIRAMEQAGAPLASAAVLLTHVGSARFTAARLFGATRTLGRTHQDVLVFCKGSRQAAAQACGPVEVHVPEALAADAEPQPAPATAPPGSPQEPPPGARTLTVSAATLDRRLDCTVAGITRAGGCGGACCRSKSFWPPSADPQPDGACHYLGPQGCTLTPEDRPVKCLLYPLVPTKPGSGKLRVHFRSTISVCKPCAGQGPMLAEAMQPSLAALAGEAEAAAFAADALAGRNAILTLPPAVAAAMAAEDAEEAAGVLPPPRTTREKEVP